MYWLAVVRDSWPLFGDFYVLVNYTTQAAPTLFFQTTTLLYMLYKIKSWLYIMLNALGAKPQAVPIEGILRQNGCQFNVTSDKDVKRYYFRYQGGNFVATVLANGSDQCNALVVFPGFSSIGVDHVNAMRTLCNHMNSATVVHKIVYRFDEEDNTFAADVECFLTSPTSQEFLRALEYCFDIRRSFNEQLQEMVDRNKADNDEETAAANDSREHYIACELEKKAIDKPELNFRPGDEKPLTMGTVLSALYGKRMAATGMTAVSGGQLEKVDAANVGQYDLSCMLLRPAEGGGLEWKCDTAMAVVPMADLVDDSRQTATITLSREHDDQVTYYYRVTASAVPRLGARHSAEAAGADEATMCKTFIVARDTAGAKQRLQEFDYMWKEARDKLAQGKPEAEFEPEQWAVARVMETDVAYCLYWGYKQMRNARYLESIAFLEPVYAKMVGDWAELGENAMNLLLDVAYRLGLCHAQIGQLRDAAYYLEMAHRANRYRNTTLYVETLRRLKSPKCVTVTGEVLDGLNIKANEDEGDMLDDNQQLKDFVACLRWNRALTLIDISYLDEATRVLNVLQNSPRYHDDAIAKLAEIEVLKAAKAGTAGSKDDGQDDKA